MKLFFAILVILHCSFLISLNAQPLRKTVGLVLSGGGAKGIAHVGVLKYLEENNISVDYITGTSMGAIVGGFYASGYSALQIEELILSEDFQTWSSGKIVKDAYFVDDNKSADMFSFFLNLDSNFQASFKSNLIEDSPINFALAERLYQASKAAKYNFDNLPIPFRCIAADIFTQQSIILKDGNLNDAVRASMTVPLFFRPIKIDGKYLYDGGIYNNFPVDVMRDEFNPDIIIGVNVSSKAFEEYPFENDEELISNSLKYFLLDNTDQTLLNEGDVFIEPSLDNFSPFDFSKPSQMIALGYAAAQYQSKNLENVIGNVKLNSLETSLSSFENFDVKNINFIEIDGLKNRQKGYVRSVLKPKNEMQSVAQLRNGYYRLISNEYFRGIYPEFVYDTLGNYNFRLKVNPKEKVKLSIGGNLSTRSISTIYAGIDYDFLSRALYNFSANAYAGRFYTSGRASIKSHYPSNLPFYMELEGIINKWEYTDVKELVLKNRNESAFIIRKDKYLVGNLGTTFRNNINVVLSAGVTNNHDEYFNKGEITSSDELDETQFHAVVLSSVFKKNTLNRKQFPSKGKMFEISLKYFTGIETHEPGTTSLREGMSQHDREWVAFKYTRQQYFGNKIRIGYHVEGLVSNQPTFVNYQSSLINAPSFDPLIDSRTIILENFRGYTYGAAGLISIIPLFRNIEMRLEGYGFASKNRIIEGENQNPVTVGNWENVHGTASTSIIFNSILGPLSASLNYYDDPNYPFGFLVNFGFILFNKKAMN
ncbi:MAG: patatin-like phospholipase family protein [Flammeovirgaceae bacterium]|nr:patatin-like phospholipase family protein [Flammeovirgaceae bacterium]